jgi:hypothetical protein
MSVDLGTSMCEVCRAEITEIMVRQDRGTGSSTIVWLRFET